MSLSKEEVYLKLEGFKTISDGYNIPSEIVISNAIKIIEIVNPIEKIIAERDGSILIYLLGPNNGKYALIACEEDASFTGCFAKYSDRKDISGIKEFFPVQEQIKEMVEFLINFRNSD